MTAVDEKPVNPLHKRIFVLREQIGPEGCVDLRQPVLSCFGVQQ
jgi:hypothetical protein